MERAERSQPSDAGAHSSREAALVFLVAFAASWPILYDVVYDVRLQSDFGVHLKFVDRWLAGWGTIPPHFLFHVATAAIAVLGIPQQLAAVSVAAAATGLTATVVHQLYLPADPQRRGGFDWRRATCTVAACIATAIYLYGFNTLYTGQSSPTVWHNPTAIVLKPFALLSALYVERIVSGDATWRLAVLAFATLLLGIFAKPAFALVFVPVALGMAAVLFVAPGRPETLGRLPSASARSRTALLALGLATAVAVWIQSRYVLDTHPGFELEPLRVWSEFTPNIPVSLLLALAFPLAVTLMDMRHRTPVRERSGGLVLAWCYCIVGAFALALFAERGALWQHGNLGWSYQIGLSVLYAVTLRHYLAHWRTSPRRWDFRLATTLLVLCVASGAYYVFQIVALQRYH